MLSLKTERLKELQIVELSSSDEFPTAVSGLNAWNILSSRKMSLWFLERHHSATEIHCFPVKTVYICLDSLWTFTDHCFLWL